MKKKCFQSAALVLGMLTVSSQMLKAETVVLLEDFESYSNNSQMTAVWNLLPIGTFNNLDTTVGNNGNSLRMNSPDINGLGRLIRNLPGGPITADATTNIVMSVDMLLDDLGAPGWNGARHFCEIRSYANGAYNDGALQELVALGVFNSTTNPFSTLFYQGRLAFTSGVNWQTLNGEAGAVGRSIGWHNLKVVISVSDAKFYVDDVLSHVTAAPPTLTYDSAVLGGNLSAAGHTAWFDNFKVSLVPTGSTSVVNSYVVHNGWTGSPAGENIDSVKSLYKETNTPTPLSFDNVINTSQGINGVGFDVAGLPSPVSVTLDDFVFEMSPTGIFSEPVAWMAAPAPSLTVVEGSPDQLLFAWANNQIKDRWLRLTIKGNSNTGLEEDEVYYLGHLLGKTTGLAGSVYNVTFADITPIRGGVGNVVDASSILDIDKSGTITFGDITAMRGNVGISLPNITVPPPSE